VASPDGSSNERARSESFGAGYAPPTECGGARRRVIVGIAGGLGRPSRTRTLVETAVERAADRYRLHGEVFDLKSFGPSLGSASRLADLDRDARAAVERMLGADALVLASPVYKGSYSGLFKHLIDELDPQ
jgi:FMN reductase